MESNNLCLVDVAILYCVVVLLVGKTTPRVFPVNDFIGRRHTRVLFSY